MIDYSKWNFSNVKNPNEPIVKMVQNLFKTIQEANELTNGLNQKINEIDKNLKEGKIDKAMTIVNKAQNMVDKVNVITSSPLENPTKLNVNEICVNLVNEMKPKRLVFRPDFQHGTKFIYARYTQIYHVIQSIIKNAVEATWDIEHPELTLNIRNDIKNKNHIRIEISNNGPCINPKKINDNEETLLYIFNKFTNKPGHEGIGLMHAKKLVKEIDGYIGIKNLKPSGVCFSLIFSEYKDE